ncbi:MAG: DNA-3-methyladenine glycosylase 2 family protein [Bacteroidetes bacterium]|nr:DNA-3-methyladenine glycosylase 2 family protein [Bacteroidota bacterium]
MNVTDYLNNQRLSKAVKCLSKKDKDLAALYEADSVPPLWARRPGFTTLIKIILEQQVSLASAKAVYRKLERNIKPFTPIRFEELGIAYLKSLGITRQKSSYCINIAAAILDDRLDLKSLNNMNDDDAKEMLKRIKGIGSWTADIYLLMALRRPDIWPSGDIALASSMQKIKRLRSYPNYEKQIKIAEKWQPYRSVAARMLWQHYIKNN